MKIIEDALNIRNHVLLKVEAAVRATSVEDKERLRTLLSLAAGRSV